MPKIPIVSGKDLVKALQKIGYKAVRQKGSHIRLINQDNPSLPAITIPDHKEVSIGVMRKLIRDTRIPVEELTKLLK